VTGPASSITAWRSYSDRLDLVPHRERQASDRLEVVPTWLWQPARHHMGVADRLDLLDALRIASRSNAEKISSKRATSSSAAMTNDRSL
jgi:hypothetical protein